MTNPPNLQPYLTVDDAERAIALYTSVLGFREIFRLPMGDRLGHAELEAPDGSRLLLASEFPEADCPSARTLGGSPVLLVLYVEDLDATLEAAEPAGFTIERGAKAEFYGDRAARIRDPFGHRWALHQRLESLSPEEIVRRFEAEMSGA